MTMQCLDAQAALETYMDGDLVLEQAAHLERHLAECEGCRAELAYLQTVEAALETWPLATEPAGLTARVMARIEPRPALPRFRLRWSDLALSLAGAGTLLVFTLPLAYAMPSLETETLQQAWSALQLELLPLEMLQLDVQLQLQRLSGAGATSLVLGGLLCAGVLLALVLIPAALPPSLRARMLRTRRSPS